MSWMAGVLASITIFLGSLFGAHAPAQAPAAPQNSNNSQQVSARGASSGAPGQAAMLQSLMQQIGCSDQSSCINACAQSGMTAACAQLQTLMAVQQSQGRSSSAYTAGSPSGGRASDVAFVGNGTAANAGALPDCPANNALFDAWPIKAADLAGIEPLGHMNGEHILPNQADHVYLQAKSSATTAVYAPGDATLLQVNEQTGIAGGDTGTNSVKLYFSPCKSVMFVLQLSALSPQIKQALSSVQPSGTQTGATVKNTVYGPLTIPITSGEELGTVVGYNGYGGEADFGAADVRTSPLQFIDQGEATGMLADSYLHAVCPLDYFGSSLKATLYSMLTIKNAGANGIPACGAVMQDKAGTAQGNWYDKSAATPAYQGINESALLAIVHSNLDASQGVVSVGTALIPSAYLGTQLIFQPKSSGYINREPSQITPDGHVYCFDGPLGAGGHGATGHIDIRLDSATKLAADYASGACASSPTLSNPVVYER